MRYLTDVSVASDGCTDRVTFRFEAAVGALTPGFSVEYREGPFRDSSNRSTEVAGGAFLTVRLRPARIARVDASGVVDTYQGPRIVTPDPSTVGVQQVGLYGAFEGNLRFVIGLDRVRPFRLTPGTDAFVVEIGEP